jgi:hypothetical protein
MLSSLAASQRLSKQAGEGALDVLELCIRKYPDLQGTDEGPALGHLLQYLRGGGAGLIPKQVYKVRGLAADDDHHDGFKGPEMTIRREVDTNLIRQPQPTLHPASYSPTPSFPSSDVHAEY